MALSQIPPYVNVLSKSGGVRASRSEAVLIDSPVGGPYVFAVLTRQQKDQNRGLDNEAYVLIRRVSRFLWQRFEPGSSWKPPELDRFRQTLRRLRQFRLASGGGTSPCSANHRSMSL